MTETNAIICYTKCWDCQFGDHYTPPKWHTWADDDDVEHAANTGQSDPRESRCGCFCARSEAQRDNVTAETDG